MKLKEMVEVGDIVKKFTQFIDKIEFSKHRITGKDVFYGDCKKDFCIYCDESVDDNELKSIIKKYINKYWKNFETEIDFHRYDENYFIEIKQKANESNIWEFILEAKDDTIYMKFNSNFVTKL